tara:strand:+ start:1114 stop:5352 length:4239 start_codon:yes stop_codon:yes gene_type:complete
MDTTAIDISGFKPREAFATGFDDEVPYTFLDADTIKNDSGELFRVQGLSAPEIMHQIPTGGLTPPGPGGYEYTKQIDGLAKKMGFTNVHRITHPDGSPMMDATGKRQLVRITDDQGRDFVQMLSLHGINKLGQYSSQSEIDAYRWGQTDKLEPFQGFENENLNDFEKAKRVIDDVVDSENYYGTQFKRVAEDERELAMLRGPRQPGESIQQYALRLQAAQDYTGARVGTRDYRNRTIENKALHPWSESWDIGWTGVIEGLYGAAQMVGEKTGINWVETLGDKGIKRQHEYLQRKPELKLNILKPVLDNDGNVVSNDWDVGGIGGFFEYMGNMAAIALPYMGVTAGAAVLAPITGGSSLAAATGIGALNVAGLSMTVPVAMYAGQTWNEMEGDNKDAGLAVAAGVTMAALDRLGILGLMGGTKGLSLLSKSSRDKAVAAYLQKYPTTNGAPTTEAIAKAKIAEMSRLEAAKLVGVATNIAKDQLKFGNIIKSFTARAARGFGVESTTEVGQELTGYMAAVMGSDKPFDTVELHNRLVNAFVAGGTLGAGFAVPGSVYDVGQWKNAEIQIREAEDKRLSDEGKWAQEEKARTGGVRSTHDIADNIRKKVKNRVYKPEDTTIHQKADKHKKTRKETDAWTKVKEAMSSIPMLYRGAVRYLIGRYTSNPHVRDLGSLYNGFLHRINHGESLEEFKQLQAAMFRNMIKSPAMLSKDAKFSKVNQLQLSKIVNAFGQWVQGRDLSTVDWDALPTDVQGVNLREHADWLKEFMPSLNKLGDALLYGQRDSRLFFKDGSSTGKRFDIRKLSNWMLRYRSLNKAAIEKNRNGFIKLLMKDEFDAVDSNGNKIVGFGSYTRNDGQFIKQGMTRDQATKLTNDILNNNDMVDQDSIFQVGKGRHIPASHKNRVLNLSDNTDFNEFLEQDVFANVNNAIKSATRYIAYQKYIGDDGEIINQMLDDAIAAGLPEEDANYIASGMLDYLNAESGNYKRIENQTVANVQRNILVWTAMAGLPMATISSIVEYMMTLRALTPEQINKTIKSSAKEFAQAMWTTIQDPRLQSTKSRVAKEERQAKLQKLGFFDWDVGAAQTTGATEGTFASRYLLDKFFRIIGLQQWTDYTRNIRVAIADDFIMDHLNKINEQRKNNEAYTNEVQESEEQLRNLGLDIDRLLEIANDPMLNNQGLPLFETDMAQTIRDQRAAAEGASPNALQQELDRMLSLAEWNFINEAIALPGTANRPLFYQNQHLALFTQFQGFISAFTANHIPRMWGDYVKRGTPALKYNAFAVMTMMVALGFVSQYLKDLLKYGKPTPYLDKAEVLQRGIGASGLIGVAERPLNFFFPIYETSSSNMVEEIFQTISGEAAALSNLSRAVTGAGEIVMGDIEQGVYKGLKTTPLVGPFNQMNRATARAVADVFQS